MTSSLPQDVQEVFDRFITTEYTTVDKRGQPITWPVTPYYRPGDATIDVTTGLGYPKKADDAAANPKVALLFSDPTGCGMNDPPSVLVQGTADVNDRDLDANRERYGRESDEKLPGARSAAPPDALKRFFGWYYDRIYVHVRPERVWIWRGDSGDAPELLDTHLEEVQSGHAEEPAAPHADPREREPAWDSRIDELGERYDSAVLSLGRPRRLPLLVPCAGGRRPAGQSDPHRAGAVGRADAARPGLPHRARPRTRLRLAAQLPGARRPDRGRARLGARSRQAGRGL